MEFRAIAEPESESVIRGSRVGFIENFKINVSLIRQEIKDPNLRIDTMEVGTHSHQKVAICYVRPVLSNRGILDLKGSRHPVVESVIDKGNYISNDCYMDSKSDLFLITGPNMSGKSTYMRQIALNSILAQIGCFVACDFAEIPLFDHIFTRIGAADDLVSGQSTFMVEMVLGSVSHKVIKRVNCPALIVK